MRHRVRSKSETGEHFRSTCRSLPDTAVAAGCVAFGLAASAGVIFTTANMLSDGGRSFIGLDGATAAVTQGSKKPAKVPAGEKPAKKPLEPGNGDTPSTDVDSDSHDTPVSDGTSDSSDAKGETASSPDTMNTIDAVPAQDTAIDTATKVHMVAWGETLTEISARYGVSVDALAQENQIRDVDLIYAQSALIVPGR